MAMGNTSLPRVSQKKMSLFLADKINEARKANLSDQLPALPPFAANSYTKCRCGYVLTFKARIIAEKNSFVPE
jgi:hypothetical protein